MLFLVRVPLFLNFILLNILQGMVGIGGLYVMGGGYFPGTIPQALGALSVLLASINVAGGFVITKRMLDMFKRAFFIPKRPSLPRAV